MATIKTILWPGDPKKHHSGVLLYHVKIRITSKGDKYYPLNIRVPESSLNREFGLISFDKKLQEVLPAGLVEKYNARINKMAREAKEYIEANHWATPDQIRQHLASCEPGAEITPPPVAVEAKITLLKYLENYIDKCEKGKIPTILPDAGVIRAYHSLKYHLQEFDTYLSNTDLPIINDFHGIGKAWYNEFIYFMRHVNTYKYNGKDEYFAESSIGKDIKCLKVLLTEALEDEGKVSVCQEHRKKYFKKPAEEADTIALTVQEVAKLEVMDLSEEPHLAHERDRWIVAYYFLIRFSDSIRIDNTRIINIEGKLYFSMRSKKKDSEIMLPIKPSVYAILERNNFCFETIRDTDACKWIKQVCRLAGLNDDITIRWREKGKIKEQAFKKWQLVSPHTSRRSGATAMWLAGVPEQFIMDVGGWKTREAFWKYIRADKLQIARMASDHYFFK